ncbi:MAG: sigma-E processing peptidase SpoIIGA [Clostridia bacterium]|nr:sigma-E processing peptidase SpoIIGA [Clostridia bacterium]
MYIELFLLDNILYNYLMLKLASVIRSEKLPLTRHILFSVCGALYAALSFLFPLLMSLPFKVLSGMLFSLCFVSANIKSYLCSVASVFISAFITGGLTIAVVFIFSGSVQNNIVFASIPIRIALIAFVICCSLPALMRRMLSRRSSGYIVLHFSHNSKTYRLNAFIDSGNMLCEPITSLPVILIYAPSLEVDASIPVPIMTANGESIVFAFKPESIRYKNTAIDALLGLSSIPFQNADALVPSSLIPLI